MICFFVSASGRMPSMKTRCGENVDCMGISEEMLIGMRPLAGIGPTKRPGGIQPSLMPVLRMKFFAWVTMT